MAEWKLEQTQFRNVAFANTRSGLVEADIEDETLQVDVENGSGYLREHTTAYIPVEVLVKLLTHAGYRVEKSGEALEERGRASKTTTGEPDLPHTVTLTSHKCSCIQCCNSRSVFIAAQLRGKSSNQL